MVNLNWKPIQSKEFYFGNDLDTYLAGIFQVIDGRPSDKSIYLATLDHISMALGILVLFFLFPVFDTVNLRRWCIGIYDLSKVLAVEENGFSTCSLA